jgi:hypothetical protein
VVLALASISSPAAWHIPGSQAHTERCPCARPGQSTHAGMQNMPRTHPHPSHTYRPTHSHTADNPSSAHPRSLWVLLHRRPPGLKLGPPVEHCGPPKVLGQDLCRQPGRDRGESQWVGGWVGGWVRACVLFCKGLLLDAATDSQLDSSLHAAASQRVLCGSAAAAWP